MNFKDYIKESGEKIPVKVKKIPIGTKEEIKGFTDKPHFIYFDQEKLSYSGKIIKVQQLYTQPDFYVGKGMIFHKSWLDFNFNADPNPDLELDI